MNGPAYHLTLRVAMADQRLTASDKIVMCIMLDIASQDGQAWPSLSTIATASGLSRRCVTTCLGRLRRTGWLNVIHCGTPRASTRYQVRVIGGSAEPLTAVIHPPLDVQPEFAREGPLWDAVLSVVGAPTRLSEHLWNEVCRQAVTGVGQERMIALLAEYRAKPGKLRAAIAHAKTEASRIGFVRGKQKPGAGRINAPPGKYDNL